MLDVDAPITLQGDAQRATDAIADAIKESKDLELQYESAFDIDVASPCDKSCLRALPLGEEDQVIFAQLSKDDVSLKLTMALYDNLEQKVVARKSISSALSFSLVQLIPGAVNALLVEREIEPDPNAAPAASYKGETLSDPSVEKSEPKKLVIEDDGPTLSEQRRAGDRPPIGDNRSDLELQESFFWYASGGAISGLGLLIVAGGGLSFLSQTQTLDDASALRPQKDRALRTIPVAIGAMVVGAVVMVTGFGVLLYGNAVAE